MGIRAGELRHRITIETPTVTQNEYGEDVPTWGQALVWAKAIETPGREFVAGAVQAEGRVVFLIRRRTVASTARVVWKGRTYGIEDVTEADTDGTMLHCKAVDGAN